MTSFNTTFLCKEFSVYSWVFKYAGTSMNTDHSKKHPLDAVGLNSEICYFDIYAIYHRPFRKLPLRKHRLLNEVHCGIDMDQIWSPARPQCT